MANLTPANCDVNVQEYPLSTVSVTAGTCLVHTSGGYLSSATISSAVPVVAVAAETKNGVATGRSALASTKADEAGGDYSKVIAYPASPENRFVAVCSTAPTTTMLDVAWNVNVNGQIANETSTDPMFLIESIVDATAKTVLGRFVSAQYGPRKVVAPGS